MRPGCAGWWSRSRRRHGHFHHRFAGGTPNKAHFSLTFRGWEEYAALKQKRSDSRTAFMAMKFGDAELNRVVQDCFRQAVRRAGFELRVLTGRQEAGVIADLTHDSFGAYWEAGLADGRGLPVIYTCKRAKWEAAKSPFDTNHMVTIIWDAAALKSAEDDLVSTIRATLRGDAKQTDESPSRPIRYRRGTRP
jgi:hypothetical protein